MCGKAGVGAGSSAGREECRGGGRVQWEWQLLHTGCLLLEIHKIFMLQLVHSPIALAAHELWIDP